MSDTASPSFEPRPDGSRGSSTWPSFDATTDRARGILGKSMGRFYPAHGPLDERNTALLDWILKRAEAGVWPYGLIALTAPGTDARVLHPSGTVVDGINLTTVDYLGISRDPRLKAAAMQAIEDGGVHLPSSGPLMGNTPASRTLEQHVARLLGRSDAFLCPTGWAAGFAAISGVVRHGDFVVMDELAHQCLQQGAYGSTPNVQTFRHLDNGALETTLKAIRETNARDAVLVVTEGLFSMDGDAPDLRELVAISRRYGALVLVDVAHDLGAIGPRGTGTIGPQGLLDEIDIIVGSFSKCFGTNGGFISPKSRSILWAQLCFGGPYTYSTAISPIQVAVAETAVGIIEGPEGDQLRERLRGNVAYARDGAAARGLTVLGAPSPIVPILIGREADSRLAGLLSFQKGLIATCLEFPVVQRGAARYRFSMSPALTEQHLDRALDIVAASIAEAREMLAGAVTSVVP